MWEVPRSKAHKEIFEIETLIIKWRRNRENESKRDLRDRAESAEVGGNKWRGEGWWQYCDAGLSIHPVFATTFIFDI